MIKPRELWLQRCGGIWVEVDKPAPGFLGVFKFREVVRIDWDKIWEKYWEKFEGQNHKIGDDYIQQLVEKQLRGEE